MYASNSTEMDFWSRMLAGFDLPRFGRKYFFSLGSTATCVFLVVKQFVRPMRHDDWMIVGVSGLEPLWGGGSRRIVLLNFFLYKIGKIIKWTLLSVNMHIVLFCALVSFKRYTLESPVHCSVMVMVVERNPTISFLLFSSNFFLA